MRQSSRAAHQPTGQRAMAARLLAVETHDVLDRVGDVSSAVATRGRRAGRGRACAKSRVRLDLLALCDPRPRPDGGVMTDSGVRFDGRSVRDPGVRTEL